MQRRSDQDFPDNSAVTEGPAVYRKGRGRNGGAATGTSKGRGQDPPSVSKGIGGRKKWKAGLASPSPPGTPSLATPSGYRDVKGVRFTLPPPPAGVPSPGTPAPARVAGMAQVNLHDEEFDMKAIQFGAMPGRQARRAPNYNN